MENVSFSNKHIHLVIICSFLLISICKAQNNGIIPLTGLRYFNEGIIAKSIEVKIDGTQLLSNRLPLNKEIEISLQQLTGFTEDKNKTVYAADEFILVSPKGDIIFKNPNLLSKNAGTGFMDKDLKAFSIKFVITADMIKSNLFGIIKIRLYDLKSKNQLRLELPMSIARPGEALQISKSSKTLKAADGCAAVINGLKARDLVISIDTSINVAPKMAYLSLDISAIEGSGISGIFQGKESFWVYDNNLNEIKITDILLKQVKGAMENNNVDYTLKIPYRLKNSPLKIYTVRFRWESPDKRQVIDVVVTK